MGKVLDWWTRHSGIIVLVLGLLLLAWGIRRIYPPAGDIALGLEGIIFGVLTMLGEEGEEYGPD